MGDTVSRERRSKEMRKLEEFLRSLGLPWSIEYGAKHRHVRLEGRLIGVISHGNERSRDCTDIIRSARKYLEQRA